MSGDVVLSRRFGARGQGAPMSYGNNAAAKVSATQRP